MRRILTVVMALMLSASAAGARAQGGAAAGADEWATLVTANDLDVEGKTPFHLGMTFQLYDLDGKPTGTGSVEEWWTAPGSQKVVVHLAGLNEDGSAPEGADPALVRDAYLVDQLLGNAVHPVPPAPMVMAVPKGRSGEGATDRAPMQPKAQGLITRTAKFGKLLLDCTGPDDGSKGATYKDGSTACVDPQTKDALVLQGPGGKEVVLRPRTGTFHDTYVGLNLRVAYLERDAIAGKLTMMQAFDPSTSAVKLPMATASQPKVTHASVGVIAGNRIKFVEPEYPSMAKVEHLSSAVLLSAIIGKDGSVRRLVLIASTAPMFSGPAMEAVKHWVYRPFLLNGEPVEVDTMITVNFQLNWN